MRRVRLIHWNVAEAKERANRLRSADYDVIYEPLDVAGLRALREDPPSAVVIDLGRLPSQGRDVALSIRKYKATRHVPLLFVDGDPEKVTRIKDILPDAVYTTWSQIQGSLKQAIAHPSADPVVPRSLFDVYSSTPLPTKLGIKVNSVVTLVDTPEGFEETLSELPKGVLLRRQALREGLAQARGQGDVTLWFTKSRKDLEGCIEQMSAFADEGRLWIAWPKKASGMATDLSQGVVREAGLAAGLVDYKVCAIDATWSGLLFTRRKRKSK